MKYYNVVSSCINRIGYDSILLQMLIEFKDGNEYLYFDVEEETFEDFLDAKSFGKYFNWYIYSTYKFKSLGQSRSRKDSDRTNKYMLLKNKNGLYKDDIFITQYFKGDENRVENYEIINIIDKKIAEKDYADYFKK